MKLKNNLYKVVAYLLTFSCLLPSFTLTILSKDSLNTNAFSDEVFEEYISEDMFYPIEYDIMEPEEYDVIEPEEIFYEFPTENVDDFSCELGEEIFITDAIDNTEYYLRELFSIPDDVIIDKSKHIEEYFDIDLPEENLLDLSNIDIEYEEITASEQLGVSAAAANTSRITILNKTMTSVTFSYNFAANDKNRYMFFYDSYTNDWDWNISTWNDRGLPVNPPVSGTVTVNNLMPEGTYKIRMSYNNTGTWVYDYYEFTMPADTSGTVVVEGTHIKMTIPTYLRNMLGASEANRYIQALDISYNHLADLVGAVPYDGRKVSIVPDKHEGSYIARSGEIIKFRESYLIEDFLYFKRPIGLSVYSNHELSHNFDSSRWNFDAELFACFKSAYVYDMTKYSFIDHETYYANGNMTSFFKSDQTYGGYDGMIATNVYHHYGLCYRLMKIKEVIGWEPFKQTFRFFNALASQYVPTKSIDKLNLFLTKLRDFSKNTDVIAMMTTQEKSIYQAKFGGPIAYYTMAVHTDDHSDSIWSGTWLTISMPMEGNINFAGDIDCFRFEAPSTGKYIVTSGGNTSLALQTVYELLPSGSAQSKSALFSDDTKNFKKVYEFTEGKTYMFKVAHTSATASSGNYTITVKDDDGSIDDHSDSIWSGTWMTKDTSMRGIVNYAGDIDCFRFEAPSTGKYIVTSDGGTPLALQAVYELLPSGSGQGKSSLFSDSAKNFKKVYEFTEGKTYMFKVAHTSTTASSGNYTIIIKDDDGSIDDHGNSTSTGTNITLGTPTDGKINYPGDIDRFTFTTTREATYTITTTGTSLSMHLYHVNTGTNITPTKTEYLDNNVVKKKYDLPANSTYSIQIYHTSSSASSGNYTVCVKNTQDLIVVIPGMMGSRLYYNVNNDNRKIWEPNLLTAPSGYFEYSMKPYLLCNEDGSPKYPGVTFPNDESGAQDTYKKLVEKLKSEYSNQYEVIFFPYDWRLGVADAADRLQLHIGSRYDNVIIVAHSMGGLVASKYLSQDASSRNRVKHLITLGTPYTGSAKSIIAFENGAFMGDPYDEIMAKHVYDMAKNMQGVYDLLPTSRYQHTILKVDDIGKSYAQSVTFLSKRSWALRENVGYEGELKTMFLNALSLHNGLIVNGDHIVNSFTKYSYITGTSIATPSTILYKSTNDGHKLDDTKKDYFEPASGDGTVIVSSARNNNDNSANYYPHPNIAHTKLPEDDKVILQIKELINSTIKSMNNLSLNNIVSMDISSTDSLGETTSIVVQGSDEIEITDENGLTVISRGEGLYKTDVSGDEVRVGSKWLIDTDKMRYQYVLNGTGYILTISAFNDIIEPEILVMEFDDTQYISKAVYNNIDSLEEIKIDIAKEQNTVKSALTDKEIEAEFVADKSELNRMNANKIIN